MSKNEFIPNGIKLAQFFIDQIKDEIRDKELPLNFRNTYIATLVYRLMDLSKGTLLLVEQNNTATAKVAIRTLSETYAQLNGCLKFEDFSLQLFDKHNLEKIDFYEKVKKEIELSGFPWTISELDTKIGEARKRVTKNSARMTTKGLFTKLNLHKMYHQIFSFLSLHTHTDMASLDEYLTTDSDNQVISLGPTKSATDESALCLSLLMFILIEFYKDLTPYARLDQSKISLMQVGYKSFSNEWTAFKESS